MNFQLYPKLFILNEQKFILAQTQVSKAPEVS